MFFFSCQTCGWTPFPRHPCSKAWSCDHMLANGLPTEVPWANSRSGPRKHPRKTSHLWFFLYQLNGEHF